VDIVTNSITFQETNRSATKILPDKNFACRDRPHSEASGSRTLSRVQTHVTNATADVTATAIKSSLRIRVASRPVNSSDSTTNSPAAGNRKVPPRGYFRRSAGSAPRQIHK
jgi:hypothetical protein